MASRRPLDKLEIRPELRPSRGVAELNELADFSYDDESVLSQYYDDSFEPTSGFSAVLDGEVVGRIEIFKAFKRSRGFYAVLRRLAVKPQYRNTGIGTRLLRFAFEEAARQGCVEVEGNVDASNSDLMALYGKLGLKPIRHEVIVGKRL